MNRTSYALLLAGALLIPSTAFAQDAAAPAMVGDAAKGKTVFNQCAMCHAVGENAKNKVGPVLNGVVGRVAGTYEGYNYSAAMKQKGADGWVWTPETLTPFLHNPRETVPGTKMTYAGLKKDEDVANVIAYLLTFSPDYVPGAAPAADAAPASGAAPAAAPAAATATPAAQ